MEINMQVEKKILQIHFPLSENSVKIARDNNWRLITAMSGRDQFEHIKSYTLSPIAINMTYWALEREVLVTEVTWYTVNFFLNMESVTW